MECFRNLIIREKVIKVPNRMEAVRKVEIKKEHLLWSLLIQFDTLCQMRYAIVHSSRVLAGENAIKRKLERVAS